MHFAEIAAMPAILFSPKIKVATRKTAIYSTVRVHFRKFRWQYNVLCLENRWSPTLLLFRGFVVIFLIVWRHEYSLILVCMHLQRNIYQSRALDLLRNCLSDGQDGRCKQRGQTATIWLKALLMPRLAVCSRDLHWHWINWTLLCDTMEVSMFCLVWLPITQHVIQPALTGKLELI